MERLHAPARESLGMLRLLRELSVDVIESGSTAARHRWRLRVPKCVLWSPNMNLSHHRLQSNFQALMRRDLLHGPAALTSVCPDGGFMGMPDQRNHSMCLFLLEKDRLAADRGMVLLPPGYDSDAEPIYVVKPALLCISK